MTNARPRAAGSALTLVATLVACWPGGARAYRPFDGTDAAVVDRGEAEVALGVGWQAEGGERSLFAPTAVGSWGFAHDWEAVIEARQLVTLGLLDVGAQRTRVEDAAVALKHVLRDGELQDAPGASVAVEVSALVPTHDDEPGLGASGALVVSRRWKAATLHVNAAAAWTRAHAAAAFAGLIVEGSDARAVRPVAEVFGAAERGGATELSALAGAIWRASDALSIDAALRVARTGGVRAVEVRAGLTWAFAAGLPRAAR